MGCSGGLRLYLKFGLLVSPRATLMSKYRHPDGDPKSWALVLVTKGCLPGKCILIKWLIASGLRVKLPRSLYHNNVDIIGKRPMSHHFLSE